MKATLIKTNNQYYLEQIPSKGISGAVLEMMMGSTDGEGYYKVSKQNCDEIFGVVDVEKLAEEEFPYDFDCPVFETLGVTEKAHKSILIGMLQGTLIKGFNKAMELNGDKRFTLDDVRNAIQLARYHSTHNKNGVLVCFHEDTDKIIQSLQQPTEIEVEIEMEAADLAFYENGKRYPIEANIPERFKYKPKLDSEGCLILKKVEQ